MASMSMRARLLNTAVFEYEPAAPGFEDVYPRSEMPFGVAAITECVDHWTMTFLFTPKFGGYGSNSCPLPGYCNPPVVSV